MTNTQDVLNALIIAFMFAFGLLILIDFCAGLINLWCCKSNKSNPETNNTFPNPKPVTKAVKINTKQDNSFDTGSLEHLIQNLPQSRIRTAARRLGIGDKIDGKYQKLAVLRTHLQAKLELQPMEVAQVLRGLKI